MRIPKEAQFMPGRMRYRASQLIRKDPTMCKSCITKRATQRTTREAGAAPDKSHRVRINDSLRMVKSPAEDRQNAGGDRTAEVSKCGIC